MFTSSMAKRIPFEKDSLYNLRPLPSTGTRKRNPDEDFILRGRQTPAVEKTLKPHRSHRAKPCTGEPSSLTNSTSSAAFTGFSGTGSKTFNLSRLKPQNYRTNSEMTISTTGLSHKSKRTPSGQSVSFQEFNQASDEEYTQEDLALDLSEFDNGPEQELMRLHSRQKATDEFLSRSGNSDSWFINPVHRAPSPSVDIRKLSQKRPLKAAVLKSSVEGTITSDPTENIRKTSIRDFDVTLFRDAESKMLSSRTLSALATPYQEDLAKLRLDRLRLEEERLLRRKCLDELERIRGPKPRWYELKTPEFHREAKRNNNVLSLSGHYDEIMQYRDQLLSSLGEEKSVPSQ